MHDLHAQVGSQHKKRPVGEIQDTQHAEDGREPKRNKEQEHSPAEPVQQVDEKTFQNHLIQSCWKRPGRSHPGR